MFFDIDSKLWIYVKHAFLEFLYSAKFLMRAKF